MRNGLSAHVGSIWKMMQRANCEDRFLTEACTKSFSIENLSNEIIEEMASDRRIVTAQTHKFEVAK